MSVFYAMVVAVTAAAHFAFVVFGVLGGFLALRWPKAIWFHLPVVLWCVAIEIFDFACPLTWLEERARTGAEMAPLGSAGFIDHYITGVWYPVAAEDRVLGLVLVVVFTSWVLVAWSARRRRAAATEDAAGRSAVPGDRHDAIR